MKPYTRLFGIVALVMMSAVCYAVTPVHFDFEKGAEWWDIPDWALDQKDCVGKSVSVSTDQASTGASSLKIACDFPGNIWTSAIVEHEEDVNLRGYKSITADVYVPAGAPVEFLKARIIVSAESGWWIEMRSAVPLAAGKWTTVKAPFDVSPTGEMLYWQCKTKEECILANLDKVKKVSVRIEYDANPSLSGPPYKGDLYIDNVVIE